MYRYTQITHIYIHVYELTIDGRTKNIYSRLTKCTPICIRVNVLWSARLLIYPQAIQHDTLINMLTC